MVIMPGVGHGISRNRQHYQFRSMARLPWLLGQCETSWGPILRVPNSCQHYVDYLQQRPTIALCLGVPQPKHLLQDYRT